MNQPIYKYNVKKEEPDSTNANDNEEFVYNPDNEHHIGKRTGKYFRRINPKDNFDGYPRFSEYESYGESQRNSLATNLQNRSSINNKSTESKYQQQKQPFLVNQSLIAEPINSKSSLRVPHAAPPRFGEISSIKRRPSFVRDSDVGAYRQLLENFEADELDEFVLNEQELRNISDSARKEINDLQTKRKSEKIKQRVSRVSFKDVSIERFSPQLHDIGSEIKEPVSKQESSKKLKEAFRLSETKIIKLRDDQKQGVKVNMEIKVQETNFTLTEKNGEQQYLSEGEENRQNQLEQKQCKKTKKPPQQPMQRKRVTEYKHKKQKGKEKKNEDRKGIKGRQEKREEVGEREEEREREREGEERREEEREQNRNRKGEREREVERVGERKKEREIEREREREVEEEREKQKQKREREKEREREKKRQKQRERKRKTKEGEQNRKEREGEQKTKEGEQNRKEVREQKTKEGEQKTKEREGEQNRKERKSQKRNKSTKKHSKRQDANEKVEKIHKIRKIDNEIIEQFKEFSDENDENRYPKRHRMKPVNYWENEKAHYRKGKLIGIDGAHINFRELIGTQNHYETTINVNFKSHDIEAQILLPAKKSMECRGFSSPYSQLQIQLKPGSNYGDDIYFDDGIRNQALSEKVLAISSPDQYFVIQNNSKKLAAVIMRLRVKIN